MQGSPKCNGLRSYFAMLWEVATYRTAWFLTATTLPTAISLFQIVSVILLELSVDKCSVSIWAA